MGQLGDFGAVQGYDGKALESHAAGSIHRATGHTSDADWGAKKYQGVDTKTGRPREKKKSWFGCRLHLIACAKCEIPLEWKATKASKGEAPALRQQLRKLYRQIPKLANQGLCFVPTAVTTDQHRGF